MADPDNCCLVYITAPDRDTALAIGRSLVQQRLAACVNLLDGMSSIYEWQGELQQDNEVVLIAKTQAANFDALCRRVKEQHPYDCPCIVALPISAGHAPFLEWIGKQS